MGGETKVNNATSSSNDYYTGQGIARRRARNAATKRFVNVLRYSVKRRIDTSVK